MKHFELSLSVQDRLVIPALFPKQSNLLTLSVMKTISEKILIDAEFAKKIDLVVNDENIKWNHGKAVEVKTKFSEAEMEFLKNRVSELNSSNSIVPQHYETCIKINQSFILVKDEEKGATN